MKTDKDELVNSDQHSRPASPFVTTSWSLVLQAKDSDGQKSRPALTCLCEAYWVPLYTFVRRKGRSVSEAEDLTQAFFAELLGKDAIARADRERGKFRTFLLSSLENFLKNKHRDANTDKRGGKHKVLSLDFETAECQYSHEPSHHLTAEKIFDRNWAIALLNQVLGSLQTQYEDSGKAALFESLKGHIIGDAILSHKDIGDRLNMKEGAVKVAIHRLRERYGQQLRLQIAKTVETPEGVDEELNYLFAALAGD